MSKGGKFSVYEGILFTTVIIVSKILYTAPTAVIRHTGTASWYTTLISCFIAIIFFLLVCMLLNRFPGKGLAKVFEAVLGKILGKTSSLFFSGYILYYAASSLREFLEMIKVYNLPNTPPSVILITFLAVSVLFAYKGIESIVRVASINCYMILLGLFIVLVMASPYYDIDYLKPYWGYGFKKSLYLGFLRSSAYEEVLTLAIIVTSLHSVKDFQKIGIISLLLSGFVISISILCYLMADQYTMGKENLSGIFQLSRIIYYNRYIQRVESVFLFIWVISSLITVSTAFYLSVRIYCESFDIADHKPILLPFALLTYVVSLQPKNISEVVDINLKFVRQYSLYLNFGVPILVLIIALIFRKKEGSGNV
ncbi:GerAB/ArcD/ProY family transporter [Clostridium magnum]|uniref:Spore germination protein YndE n=1 Tax=Clostridium magnum DSM 2767 TaxID=1121326 RepID=A0A162RBF1_9CLOT|nr:endospore germination permease [Clostridium magnum]KZL89664.1 spore germination protein YndE [Clostridium magnum DSM 2767]SHH75707.1 spore germination protein (amino acid permease) [Clostridium magnum DSM 2767]